MVRKKRSRNVMKGENLLNRSLSRCLTKKEGGGDYYRLGGKDTVQHLQSQFQPQSKAFLRKSNDGLHFFLQGNISDLPKIH